MFLIFADGIDIVLEKTESDNNVYTEDFCSEAGSKKIFKSFSGSSKQDI